MNKFVQKKEYSISGMFYNNIIYIYFDAVYHFFFKFPFSTSSITNN